MQNSKIISEVHTPIPCKPDSSFMASSSDFSQIPSKSKVPSVIFRAKSVIYSAFRKVMPKDCRYSVPAESTVSVTPNLSFIRCHIVACAFVDICCPIIWCMTDENKSVSTGRFIFPILSMTSASRLSFCFR